MPLFEVAILELPEKKKDGKGKEKLVFGPTPVIAADPQSAAINAVLDEPDKLKNIDRSRMQVLVRPFS